MKITELIFGLIEALDEIVGAQRLPKFRNCDLCTDLFIVLSQAHK